MVGETMLEKASLTLLPGFIAMMDYQPPNLPPIAKGMIWICESEFENGLICKLPEMKSEMFVPTGVGLMRVHVFCPSWKWSVPPYNKVENTEGTP